MKLYSSLILRPAFAALLTLIAFVQAPGQEIRFDPAVDSLCLWGTCTPPNFYWHAINFAPDSDRVVIHPYWGMLVQGTPPNHITTTFDSAYFTIHDTTGLNRYELVLTCYSLYEPGRFNIPEDSLWCVLEGPLSFTLLVFHGSQVVDSLLVHGFSYQTGLRVADQDGIVPLEAKLNQNYPNPFNPTTVVSYQLPVASNVRLVVYDILGREVARLVDGVKPPGNYSVDFDGTALASGMYFAVLRSGNSSISKRLVLQK